MLWRTWDKSRLKSCFRNVLKIFTCAAILCACSLFSAQGRPARPDVSVYQAGGIEDTLIQYIWLEVPEPLEPGEREARIFLARDNPREPVIPNPTGLTCLWESEGDFSDLSPETITFHFEQDGSFSGSYTYRACPECVECYMNWDYTLEFSGVISEENATLDIAVRHIGLNVQGSYLSVELERLAENGRQPQIRCHADGTCTEIQFVDIDS